MNAAKMTLVSTVVAAALGLAFGLMNTPAAAHHNLGHMKGGPGGDGGGETPTIVTTEAQWGGNIDGGDSEPRPCVATEVKPNGDHGVYVCQPDLPNDGKQVTYNLGVGVQTARKGDELLCDVFNDIDLTPNEKYQYRWVDNCGDGSCTILIITWFDGEEVITATGEKADRIKLQAFGEAADGITGVIDDPNPFTNSHTLLIDEITTLFLANGSGKTLAVCEYSLDLGNLGVGDVIFQSDPTS